tara:strand:+ start:59 stop:346 length:288 start_codon:yes stop_codon:yes gene_type:complete
LCSYQILFFEILISFLLIPEALHASVNLIKYWKDYNINAGATYQQPNKVYNSEEDAGRDVLPVISRITILDPMLWKWHGTCLTYNSFMSTLSLAF